MLILSAIRIIIAGVFSGMLLAGCATKDQSRFTDAAIAPLTDLNLVHTEIPVPLLEAQKQPYLVPAGFTCDSLTNEIRELDDVLGPDLDVIASASKPNLVERASNEAVKAAAGALRRTTEGVVPFRGWVRKLSGAERHSKRVSAAIAAGTVRRAFVKGLRVSKDCDATAA